MAKESSDTTFTWSTMWSAWRNQPPHIQSAWMFGKGGLHEPLKDALVNCTKDVQDEMFAHAPDDVRKYFGYESKEDKAAKVKPKKSYNDEYRSQLLDKIRGITA
jgi:hypothetical protein